MRGLLALGAFDNFKGHLLTFLEALEPLHLDGGKMSKKLFAALGQLKNTNAQKEYYLTDVPAILRAQGDKVGACCACEGAELIGVNTVVQLRMGEEELRR